ncbi:MAG TPA: hypothetical protein V6C72_04250 [Chroococcales cyanobacterium]
MERNPSMTEEEWRWFLLGREARNLSAADIEKLEAQLQMDPSNMDLRIQVFSYFIQYERNNLKHENADKKLFEHALWLIENKASVTGLLGHRLAVTGAAVKPKTFAALRQAWLEQISNAPTNPAILGNAASFIVWKDLETASDLFERAYAIQPNATWLGTLIIHCNAELWGAPNLYKNKIRERIVDIGTRSLKTEQDGAPFLTCEYVCDAALDLGRLETALWSAEILGNMGGLDLLQRSKAYMGLVALRSDDRDRAIELLDELNHPYPSMFRLATELFEAGERDCVISLIRRFGRRIKKSARERWLEQIANDEPPDFRDYCC